MSDAKSVYFKPLAAADEGMKLTIVAMGNGLIPNSGNAKDNAKNVAVFYQYIVESLLAKNLIEEN